jgi:hypothetical protein
LRSFLLCIYPTQTIPITLCNSDRWICILGTPSMNWVPCFLLPLPGVAIMWNTDSIHGTMNWVDLDACIVSSMQIQSLTTLMTLTYTCIPCEVDYNFFTWAKFWPFLKH